MGTLAASGPALRNLYKSEKSSVLLGHLEKMVLCNGMARISEFVVLRKEVSSFWQQRLLISV